MAEGLLQAFIRLAPSLESPTATIGTVTVERDTRQVRLTWTSAEHPEGLLLIQIPEGLSRITSVEEVETLVATAVGLKPIRFSAVQRPRVAALLEAGDVLRYVVWKLPQDSRIHTQDRPAISNALVHAVADFVALRMQRLSD